MAVFKDDLTIGELGGVKLKIAFAHTSDSSQDALILTLGKNDGTDVNLGDDFDDPDGEFIVAVQKLRAAVREHVSSQAISGLAVQPVGQVVVHTSDIGGALERLKGADIVNELDDKMVSEAKDFDF